MPDGTVRLLTLLELQSLKNALPPRVRTVAVDEHTKPSAATPGKRQADVGDGGSSVGGSSGGGGNGDVCNGDGGGGGGGGGSGGGGARLKGGKRGDYSRDRRARREAKAATAATAVSDAANSTTAVHNAARSSSTNGLK